MKLSFTFQTLIIVALAPVLALVTAVWGVIVYRSVYDTILAGFDRKLLMLSTGVAAFVDGDAHATFQRRSDEVALTRPPGGGLLGVVAALDELVAPDPATGGAAPVARLPGQKYAALAADPITHTWIGVSRGRGILMTLDARRMLVRPLAPPAAIWSGLTGHGPFRANAATPAPLAARGLRPGASDVADPYYPPRRPPPAAQWKSLAVLAPKSPQPVRGHYTAGFLDVADPYYQLKRAEFVALQKRAGLTYLYTQVYLRDHRIFYVLDGTIDTGYSRPGGGDALPDTSVAAAEWVQFGRPPLHQVGARNTTEQYLGPSWMSPITQWAEWGLLKSCFTPVYDSRGATIAMAGADVNINIIRERTRWALFSVVFVGVLTLVAAVFISLAVARALTRPLRKIKHSALWIAAGYYGTKIEARGTREIGRLASTLNALSAHLTDENTRALGYERELAAQRRSAILRDALGERPAAGTGSDAVAGVFDLAPHAGGVAERERVVLWLASATNDALADAGVQARAACLARALLTKWPVVEAGAIAGTICAAMPVLAACAVWSGETRILHVYAHAPLQVTTGGAAGPHHILSPGSTDVPVPAGQRLSWAHSVAPA